MEIIMISACTPKLNLIFLCLLLSIPLWISCSTKLSTQEKLSQNAPQCPLLLSATPLELGLPAHNLPWDLGLEEPRPCQEISKEYVMMPWNLDVDIDVGPLTLSKMTPDEAVKLLGPPSQQYYVKDELSYTFYENSPIFITYDNETKKPSLIFFSYGAPDRQSLLNYLGIDKDPINSDLFWLYRDTAGFREIEIQQISVKYHGLNFFAVKLSPNIYRYSQEQFAQMAEALNSSGPFKTLLPQDVNNEWPITQADLDKYIALFPEIKKVQPNSEDSLLWPLWLNLA
jgi:hypothetical protein